ncbi:MAG: DUF1887 family protein [Bacteroidales bacterium]|nr:DUF1887 family protein [Bacteroidales bacterium]
MNNTIVNIIDREDPLPLYLFIREMYNDGDRVMFVSAKGDADRIPFFINLMGLNRELVDSIVMNRISDELSYELICRTVIGRLDSKQHYLVNLAGGSRYMTLAVQRSFARFNADFYYTKTRENVIVNTIYDDSIYDNDDVVIPIKHRMTVGELLAVNGLSNDANSPSRSPIRSAEYTHSFFKKFISNTLSAADHDTISLLRLHYRSRRKAMSIKALATTGLSERPRVEHLEALLSHLHFIPQNPDELTPSEVDYLTGGWFEEYVYNIINEQVNPDDISIGVHISRGKTAHNNELDVVYSKNNQLYVIECKTGVDSNRMFNEIVYKVCALREVLLGTTSKSYIFSLIRDDDGRLRQVARLMGVGLYDYNNIVEGVPFS